jgi:prophage regulatory protein
MSDTSRPKRALRAAQVAEKLGVSVPTIWRYCRINPKFPRPSKLSERVTVFDEQELDDFLLSKQAVS